MRNITLGVLIVLFVLLTGCKKAEHEIILATTTSTDNSGLLDFLLPYFEEDSGITVKVVAVGTGAALEMGRTGEADILIVHDKARELTFMDQAYGSKRSDLMFNDFVIVGPTDLTGTTLETVLSEIKTSELPFLSRGDNSGTHSKEMRLWEQYDLDYSGDWYMENGDGMGATLTRASELQAYTLSDRSTFYSMKDHLDLHIVYENKNELNNQYGVMLVNAALHDAINTEDAEVFYNWLLSEKGQDLINQFGVEAYGDNLFTANAQED